jgi:ubiquinone/menaquinone biosynthesis C-methylase UbiE
MRPLGRRGTTASDVLASARPFPPAFPFGPEDFARLDESSDADFYVMPRFVHHADDAARYALTLYYGDVFSSMADKTGQRGLVALDLASSWVTHYPEEVQYERVVGVGMNQFELERNGRLDETIVQDLNADQALPFEDGTFDAVTCALSIDYFVRPVDVLREARRVTREGGSVHVAFSNRMFPSKAIAAWRKGDDSDRIFLAVNFLHYAGWEDVEALDHSPSDHTDPLFIVRGVKR